MLSFEMAAIAQARIDEEIIQLANTLSTLHTQKNTYAPISRLPPPILARIFVYYASESDEYACDNYHSSNTYHHPLSMRSSWMCVSYVCRHWRHVALSCPALWGHLFIASSWWTEALLTRSQDVPLRMRVKLRSSKGNVALGFISRVAMHVKRLQECCLEFDGLGTRSDVSHALSVLSLQAAPTLRILKIKIRRYGGLDRDLDPGKCEQVQAVDDNGALFNGDTPMLRELELVNCGMPWCSHTLGGLTSLRLCNLGAPVQLTVAELKVVLRRMPDLVELHLENALRIGPPGSPCQCSEKLRLPSLARLFICAPLSEVLPTLSYVEIPLTTQVRLGCHQKTPPSVDDFILLCSLLSQWLGAFTKTTTPFFPIRGIAIENWGNKMHFAFISPERVYETAEEISIDDSSSYTPLVVDIELWPPLNERSDDMIVNICQIAPLVHLRNIALRDCRFSSTFWEENFWHLQELVTIKLINKGLSDLLTTLSLPTRPPLPNTEGPKSRGPRQVFAPALERLELEKVGFIDNWDGKDDRCPDKVGRLFRVLEKRKREAGRALSLLELIDCRCLDNDDVMELLGAVDVVDWDEWAR